MRNRFETLSVITNFLGSLFIALGGILLLPLVVALFSGEFEQSYQTLLAFLLPSLLSLLLGLLGKKLCPAKNLSNLQAILTVSLGWIGVSLVGAIPFVIDINSSYLDGFFEAMSGFTTQYAIPYL